MLEHVFVVNNINDVQLRRRTHRHHGVAVQKRLLTRLNLPDTRCDLPSRVFAPIYPVAPRRQHQILKSKIVSGLGSELDDLSTTTYDETTTLHDCPLELLGEGRD